MSWEHCAWAARQVTGSPLKKLVLMMLADQTSAGNPVLIMKIKTLCKLCEASDKGIRNALRDLEQSKIIGVVERFVEGNRCANGYFLMGANWPDEARQIAEDENTKQGRVSRVRESEEDYGGGAPVAGGGAENAPGVGRHVLEGGAPRTEQLHPSIIIPKQHQQQPPRATPATPKGVGDVKEAFAPENQGSFSAGEATPPEGRFFGSPSGEADKKADKAAHVKASRDKAVAEVYDYLVTRWPKKAGDQHGAAALTAIKKAIREGATFERLQRRFLEAVAAWETWDAVPPPNISKWLSWGAWDQPVRARRAPPPPPNVPPRREPGKGPITVTVSKIL